MTNIYHLPDPVLSILQTIWDLSLRATLIETIVILMSYITRVSCITNICIVLFIWIVCVCVCKIETETQRDRENMCLVHTESHCRAWTVLQFPMRTRLALKSEIHLHLPLYTKSKGMG